MDNLIFAVVTALGATLALAMIFGYFFFTEKNEPLKFLTSAWIITAAHYLFELILIIFPSGSVLFLCSQLAALTSGTLLFWGGLLFLNRKADWPLVAIPGLLAVWAILVFVIHFPFFISALPVFIYWGTTLIWTGFAFIRTKEFTGSGKMVAGSVLITLGLLTAAYPVFRPLNIWASWAYLFTAMLECCLASAIPISYFQQSRKKLADNAERIPLLLRMVEFSAPEAGLAENAERFHLFVENARDFVYLFSNSPELNCIYINPAGAEISGYAPEEYYQDPQLNLRHIHPDDKEILEQMVAGHWTDHSVTIRWLHKSGSLLWTEQWITPVLDGAGNVLFMLGIGRLASPPEAVSETINDPAHKEAEQIEAAEAEAAVTEANDETNHEAGVLRIEQAAEKSASITSEPMAVHDLGTGLTNHQFFLDRLAATMVLARAKKQNLAVLCLDLDKCRQVGNLLGRNACNQLILRATELLRNAIPDGQNIAHWGGDQFFIILPEISSLLDVENLAAEILKKLEKPALEPGQFPVTAAIGIAMYPIHGSDAGALMNCAELAVAPAKKSLLKKYNIYDASLTRDQADKVRLEEDLRQALIRQEFFLDYQGQFSLSPKCELVGAESLIRWRHPQRGLLLPDTFLPMAEETGLISQLGEWVLETACRQNKKWQESGHRAFPVSVNISASQFQHQNFANLVQTILQKTGLHPDYLILEIKGTTAFEHMAMTQDKLRRLRQIGIQVALDNFNGGALALYHLKDLPVKKIKIDRSFLKDIYSTTHMEEIMAIIISLGKQLGLITLAEGVENQHQLDLLTKFDCLQAQGNFLAPPISGKEFEIRFLLRRRQVQ